MVVSRIHAIIKLKYSKNNKAKSMHIVDHLFHVNVAKVLSPKRYILLTSTNAHVHKELFIQELLLQYQVIIITLKDFNSGSYGGSDGR